jgi:hypothetical protein
MKNLLSLRSNLSGRCRRSHAYTQLLHGLAYETVTELLVVQRSRKTICWGGQFGQDMLCPSRHKGLASDASLIKIAVFCAHQAYKMLWGWKEWPD